jgi:hypothetical protein
MALKNPLDWDIFQATSNVLKNHSFLHSLGFLLHFCYNLVHIWVEFLGFSSKSFALQEPLMSSGGTSWSLTSQLSQYAQVQRFSRMSHRTQHIAIALYMSFFNERKQSQINKGKRFVNVSKKSGTISASCPGGGLIHNMIFPTTTVWQNMGYVHLKNKRLTEKTQSSFEDSDSIGSKKWRYYIHTSCQILNSSKLQL